MYISKDKDGVLFSVDVDGNNVSFSGIGCVNPVRVYVQSCQITEYAGIASPCDNGCSLKYECKTPPEKILVTDGRIDEDCRVLCEFVILQEDAGGYDCVFCHPAVYDCIGHYGHFCIYDTEYGRIYAFPSDFYTHPLPGLIAFAYWYRVNLGWGHEGYCFIGVDKKNKPFFVEKKVLTELL